MEKLFLHELLRKPDKLIAKPTAGGAEWAQWVSFKTIRNIVLYWQEDKPEDSAKRAVHIINKVQAAGYSPDQASKRLIETTESFVDGCYGNRDKERPTVTQYILKNAIEDPEFPTYVFTKDFWRVLRKTNIKDLESALPTDFLGCIRFPEPVMFRGFEITETICASGDVDGIGKTVFGIARNEVDGIFAFMPQEIEEHKMVHDIWKAIVYIRSGDPDCRDQKNKIRYEHKGGKRKPAVEHGDFSEMKFSLIGYNWMKLCEARKYTKESWLVEPYGRYQAYGPRDNPSYKYIIIEGHERRRHVPSADEAAAMI